MSTRLLPDCLHLPLEDARGIALNDLAVDGLDREGWLETAMILDTIEGTDERSGSLASTPSRIRPMSSGASDWPRQVSTASTEGPTRKDHDRGLPVARDG